MFVIYDTLTGYIARKQCRDMTYPTERGAKIAATRLNSRVVDAMFGLKESVGRYLVMTHEQYNFYYNPMVETVNILTGKKCMIRKSELGGCCDPGTERYHCM